MYYTQSRKHDLFPYDQCDSFEKFDEGLPKKDKFCNSLTNSEIGNKDLE